jgi:hypothetical protein
VLTEKRKFLIKLILALVAFFVVLNVAVGRRVFLAGEYLFSFDFPGQVINNLSRWPGANLASCKGCPAFYPVSLWYSFVFLMFLSVGQVLHFNPFVFDLLTLVVTQILALYYLLPKLSPKFNRFAFVVASIVFITFPHKIYLLSSASKDGVIQGLLTLFFSMAWFTFGQIEYYNKKQLIIRSFILGLLLSTSLNIAIAHFPIFLYGYLVIILLTFVKKHRYWQRLIAIIASTGAISLLINLPLALSYFKDSNVHTLSGFRPFSITDSFMAGAVISNSNILLAKFFLMAVFFLLLASSIRLSKKVLIISLYVICAYFLAGLPFHHTYLYRYLFDFVPFFNHLRALYRLEYFELLLITISVYLGLSALSSKHRRVLIAASFILVVYPASYLIANSNLFHSAQIPEEYFQASQYLKSLPDKKIYFPAYWSDASPSLTSNYTWLSEKAAQPTLYTNPFTSLFALPNMIQFENAMLSPQQSELKSLIEYSQEPDQIIDALEYAGIKYLILDRNYLWSKNFPYLDLDKLVSGLELKKRFGNLYVYSLMDKSSACLSSYGDFRLGYCYDSNHPKFLFNKSQKDLLLQKVSLSHPEFLIAKRKDAYAPNNITDVATGNLILKKKILIPLDEIFTVDSNTSDIFSKQVLSGYYKLFIPILKMSNSTKIFRNQKLIVRLGENIISEISPYSAYEGIVWEEYEVPIYSPSRISVSTQGNGQINLGKPLLIPQSVWSDIARDLDQKTVATTKVKINEVPLKSSDLYNNFIDVDLLDQNFISNFSGLTQDPSLVDGFPAYTFQNPVKLDYTISSDKAFSSVTITVGSAYLNSDTDGTFLIKSKSGKIIYTDSISTHGDYLRNIKIPQSILLGEKDLVLSIYISKPRILLYRLTIGATLSE